MNFRFRIGLIVSALLFLGAAAWFASKFQRVVVALENHTPFEVVYCLSYPRSGKEWNTVGWYTLQPGTRQVIKKTIFWIKPMFFVYGSTTGASSELVKWIYKDRTSISVSDGAYTAFLTNGVINEFTNGLGVPASDTAYKVGFDLIAEVSKNRFVYRLEPYHGKDNNILTSIPALDHPNGALLGVQLLAESLNRQMKYLKAWEGKQRFPFSLGLIFDDEDNASEVGVKIIRHLPQLPRGQPMPFQESDEIISFAGRPVLGAADIFSLLFDHATDMRRGCKKAIPVTVLRAGQHISFGTTYWFDKQFWQSSSIFPTEASAGFRALVDSATMGTSSVAIASVETLGRGAINLGKWALSKITKSGDPEYLTGPPFEERIWTLDQTQEMARQFHSNVYKVAEFSGFFVSPTRIAARMFGGRTVARFASSTIGAISFEMAEQIVWVLNDGSPVRSGRQLTREISVAIPLAAAGGVVQRILR